MKKKLSPFDKSRIVKRSKMTLKKRAPLAIPRQITPSGANFLPARMRMRLKYVDDAVTFTELGVTIKNHAYRASGMYDPNQSAGGHQPMGFDNMMELYDHYIVNSSVIKVTFQTVKFGNMSAAIVLDDNATGQTQMFSVLEQPNVVNGNFSVYTQPLVLTYKYDAAKVWGDAYANQSNLTGDASGNPSEEQYFIITVNGLETDINTTVYALVEIWYDVTFFEVKTLTPS